MRRFIVTVMLLIAALSLSTMVVLTQEDMEQANKEAVRAAYAAYSSGDVEAIHNLLAEPFMMNQGDATLYETTHADIEGFDQALMGAMPDLQSVPQGLLAQGEWVAVEVTHTGTFSEPYHFVPITSEPVPPTGETVQWTELNFLHFNDEGLIDEVWSFSDISVLFGQLGLFPAGDDSEGPGGTALDLPAGHQALSAEELEATYTSGMEERNVGLTNEQAELGLGWFPQFYNDPYIDWRGGSPFSLTSSEAEEINAPFSQILMQAMPDTELTINQIVAEGDWVAAIVTFNGTFTEDADFFGTSLTHTDEVIEAQFAVLDRYDADGKIVEEWFEGDLSPLFIGLGLMPPMDEG